MTGRLEIPRPRTTCGQPTGGGPCLLRPEHHGRCLPAPDRRARSANDPIASATGRQTAGDPA